MVQGGKRDDGLKEMIDLVPAGPQGIQGEQGSPGEVTFIDLYANSAANISSVDDLNQTLSDPPTLAEIQLIQNKLNELIAALRR